MTYGTEKNRWFAGASSIVDEILFWAWDPIGVSSSGFVVRDEYRAYANQVTKIALETDNAKSVSDYLQQLAQSQMGLSQSQFDLHQNTAILILDSLEWYLETNPRPR